MLKNNQPEFTGIYTFLGFAHTREIEDADAVFYGVPFEMEVNGRPGCGLGPGAIRRYSSCKPYHEELDFDILDSFNAVDYGGFTLFGCHMEDNIEQIRGELSSILKRTGGTTISVGGSYGIVFGELAALKEKYGTMGLIVFSSRTDTWFCGCLAEQSKKYYGAQCEISLHRVLEQELVAGRYCIQLGMRGGWPDAHNLDRAFEHGVEVIEANWLHEKGMDAAAVRIKEKIGDIPVFVLFDIGFLDPAFAPGAASPAVGGFSVLEALKLLRISLIGLNIVGMNLVGVSPLYDPAEITCVAARRILREFTAILSYNKKSSLLHQHI